MIADPEAMHPLVRKLAEEDLDRVFEIETAAYPFPWSRGIFSDCLRADYDCWGLQAGAELLGYCIQTHAAGECHLLNLCVAPDWQQRGMGSILLAHAIRLARRQGCESMYLEVRPSNPAGFALYAKNGFEVVGERPDYYRAGEGSENAIVMRLSL
jgi:ribosomal-protein-alanine N-acetyltransferase